MIHMESAQGAIQNRKGEYAMIHATIYENGEFFAETTIDSDDSFNALLWAHRMGWEVIEFASTTGKLETVSGIPGIVEWEFI